MIYFSCEAKCENWVLISKDKTCCYLCGTLLSNLQSGAGDTPAGGNDTKQQFFFHTKTKVFYLHNFMMLFWRCRPQQVLLCHLFCEVTRDDPVDGEITAHSPWACICSKLHLITQTHICVYVILANQAACSAFEECIDPCQCVRKLAHPNTIQWCIALLPRFLCEAAPYIFQE